jgi:hypothetical protein
MTWKRITGIIFPMTIAGCPRAKIWVSGCQSILGPETGSSFGDGKFPARIGTTGPGFYA